MSKVKNYTLTGLGYGLKNGTCCLTDIEQEFENVSRMNELFNASIKVLDKFTWFVCNDDNENDDDIHYTPLNISNVHLYKQRTIMIAILYKAIEGINRTDIETILINTNIRRLIQKILYLMNADVNQTEPRHILTEYLLTHFY